ILVGIVYSRFLGDFVECPIAAIAIEQVRFAQHSPWPALHRDSLEAAILFILAKVGQMIDVEMNVAGDEQINMPVAVVVAPRRAGAEPSSADSSLVGNVLKLTSAEVVIESVAAV